MSEEVKVSETAENPSFETDSRKKRRINPVLIVVLIIALVVGGYYAFRFKANSLLVKLRSDSAAVVPVQNENTSNILIAYFSLGEDAEVDVTSSASVTVVDKVAKGNVRAVADMIHEKTGGDLYSVQTVEKYDKSYSNVVNVAKNEQDSNARPELANHIQNFDSYDVIFVGFPTWWGDIPQAMYTFFDEYDFSGKTIIPFNSANGSKFGISIESIKKLEPNATVIEDGISIDQGDAQKSKDDVSDWLTGLGY